MTLDEFYSLHLSLNEHHVTFRGASSMRPANTTPVLMENIPVPKMTDFYKLRVIFTINCNYKTRTLLKTLQTAI